jgi:CxxC motif-containing protein (DUF1111 family)
MTWRDLAMGVSFGTCCVLGVSVAIRVTAQGQTSVGAPLAGLTPVEFDEFRLGLDDFTEVETAEEGLGPAFNGTSCAVCHNVPAIGGGGVMLETRVGYRQADGRFRGLNPEGDTLMHLFSVPSHGCQPMIPEDVTVVARRAPISLFGAGLVEAIPDETLRALEDPLDRNGDGVSGRATIIRDIATGEPRVGRFGWKAQHATLLAFGADAYRNEMGITNDLFAVESAHGISEEQFRRCDVRPEPEDVREPRTGRRGIDNFESFMRFLAPVGRGPVDDVVRDGERLFMAIGCGACHTPTLTTGPSANPLFNRVAVPLFSDLLLHDIGTGDGIAQGAGEPEEIRTPALWGLRLRRPLMHDGSAATIDDAIRQHRGEAALALQGVAKLSPEERARLLVFLRSL